MTVRVQIDEPKRADKPSCAWFDHALDELGSHVIEQLESIELPTRKLDYLIAHIPSIATYKPAYQQAMSLCDALESENE